MNSHSPFPGQDGPQPGLLKEIFVYAAGAVLLVATFMFSLVVLAVALVAGAALFGYFWWKTRTLRKAMRTMPPHAADGSVIEGEAVVVETRHETLPVRLPEDISPR
jgi:uncharacterized protein (DUF58 family)